MNAGPPSRATWWFAKDVGRVKQVRKLADDTEAVGTLRQFTPKR